MSHKYFFFRNEENIRNRFGPMDIGYSTFSTSPLPQENPFEDVEESEDLLALAISEGIIFFKYMRKIVLFVHLVSQCSFNL